MKRKKLDQFHKTPNISHFTPIKTDCTHKQGGGLIENNISFSQLNTSNIFSIELQIIKIHLSTSQQLHCKHVHSTQLSQTEEDLITSSMLTTITSLPNTIITADVNAHSPLGHLLTEDPSKEPIKDKLFCSITSH